MKKFAKMSLVAAVAVAGLSTTASAKPLEEAIKNVDVSGSVVYRYNDYNNDETKASSTTNYYKVGLTAKAKVNDDVTAVTRFIVGSKADGGFAGLDTSSNADTNVDVTLNNVYFQYTGIANTTVKVGKQPLTTPWTIAIDPAGNEQTGTGILALSNVGPVTLAAGYFNQTNLGESGALNDPFSASDFTGTDAEKAAKAIIANSAYGEDIGSRNIAVVAAMANVGPVALDAWYLDMTDAFDSYTVGATANFDVDTIKLTVGARHTALDFDDLSTDNSLTQFNLAAKMGIFNGSFTYAMTDDEGGLVALDGSAKTAVEGWSVGANGKADADYYRVVLGAQVMPKLHVSANFTNIDYKSGANDMEEEELYAQVVYKMSKNFSTYVRYGTYTKDENSTDKNDDTRGRLHVQYSF